MAAAVIPHARIRELRDRSWTAALIEALHGADASERDAIGETLAALIDPRAVAGLTAIVVSPSGPRALRELAGAILRGYYDAPPPHVLQGWWVKGDRVLRRHALRSMPDEAAEVLEVAADPRHPLYGDAIAQLAWGYEEPAHQQLKIAALVHADPDVRVIAADALVWDEPVAAEAALIAALADPIAEVALAARAALIYYDSRRVMRALATVPAPAGAEHFADDVRADVAVRVRAQPAAVRAHLADWLRPIADLLPADDEDDATRAPAPRSPTATEPPGADEILALLAIVDGPWALARAQLGRVAPAAVAPAARAAIAERATTHPDADVRALATGWLAAWADEPRLRALLDDDAFLVRKAAAYACAALPPTPALAARLLAHLHHPGVASTHARETLASYAVHAPPAEALPVLDALAGDDRRESVRTHAVHLLTERGARARLAPRMAALADPPRVTWALHIALLEAARRLALPAPAAADLAEVDSLAVQLALAELATAD